MRGLLGRSLRSLIKLQLWRAEETRLAIAIRRPLVILVEGEIHEIRQIGGRRVGAVAHLGEMD